LDPDPHQNGKRDPDPDPTVVYLIRNTAIMPMLPASTLTVYPHPSSHFDEELDPDPHRSEQLDSDPNQNERGIRIQILQYVSDPEHCPFAYAACQYLQKFLFLDALGWCGCCICI
jgi:hypothetical protein